MIHGVVSVFSSYFLLHPDWNPHFLFLSVCYWEGSRNLLNFWISNMIHEEEGRKSMKYMVGKFCGYWRNHLEMKREREREHKETIYRYIHTLYRAREPEPENRPIPKFIVRVVRYERPFSYQRVPGPSHTCNIPPHNTLSELRSGTTTFHASFLWILGDGRDTLYE
jgi:hypothetical protein